MKLIGFVDDDESLAGHTMQGLRIYSRHDLPELVVTRGLEEVLLALPRTSREHRNAIVQELQKFGLYVRTLPALDDLSTGKVTANDLREIEIEDLLGRETVDPDVDLLRKKIADRVVLVTGAAGSIGSELCRQIIDLGPTALLLYDISESGIFALERQLRRLALNTRGVPPEIVPLLGCVRDRDRLDEVFTTWRPQTVYHAAAYKHVPLSEQNPAEAIRTNIFGTRNVAEVSLLHGVADFVLISTDKAVRPTNVMGASKRVAELVLQAMHQRSENTTYSMVRFGNVLGSSGSVVPVFREQIRSGGPVTLTHPEVTRYFMTIPEAAQLVIQAGALARGGEVFLLEMGEAVRVYELARAMIELSGLLVRDAQRPDGDIEINIIGLRPGEKLYEELLIGESAEATSHPRIFKAHENCLPSSELDERLHELLSTLRDRDVARLLAHLQALVPEFKPKIGAAVVPPVPQIGAGAPLRVVN